MTVHRQAGWLLAAIFGAGACSFPACADEFGRRLEQPAERDIAPSCDDVPWTRTRGWKGLPGARHRLVPPGFREFHGDPRDPTTLEPVIDPETREPQVVSNGKTWLLIAGDQGRFPWAEDFAGVLPCRGALGARDVLVYSREDPSGRTLLAIWKYSPWIEEDARRGDGVAWLASCSRRADVPLIWTMLRSWHGPFPMDIASDRPRDLADHACPVSLTIDAPRVAELDDDGTFSLGQDVVGRFENRGDRTVILVAPDDGSSDARRTPVTWLEVERDGQRLVDRRVFAGCGLMNSLRPDSVVEIPPGWAWIVDAMWSEQVMVAEPGTYSLRVHYWNDPSLPWEGGDSEDPTLLERMRGSTPCELVSNAIGIRVRSGDDAR